MLTQKGSVIWEREISPEFIGTRWVFTKISVVKFSSEFSDYNMSGSVVNVSKSLGTGARMSPS